MLRLSLPGSGAGSFVEIRNNAEDCLLTFVRETPENRVVALLNVSPYEVHADFDTGIYAGGYADALTANAYSSARMSMSGCRAGASGF